MKRGAALMAVPVQTEPSFTPATPEVLFEGDYFFGTPASSRKYDVASDGQRFLMIKEGGTDEAASPQIILVQNWFEELRRLVATN